MPAEVEDLTLSRAHECLMALWWPVGLVGDLLREADPEARGLDPRTIRRWFSKPELMPPGVLAWLERMAERAAADPAPCPKGLCRGMAFGPDVEGGCEGRCRPRDVAWRCFVRPGGPPPEFRAWMERRAGWLRDDPPPAHAAMRS